MPDLTAAREIAVEFGMSTSYAVLAWLGLRLCLAAADTADQRIEAGRAARRAAMVAQAEEASTREVDRLVSR